MTFPATPPLRSLPILALVLVLEGCSSSPPAPAPIELHTTAELLPAIQAFAAAVPWSAITVTADADPVAALHGGDGLRVALVTEQTGWTECFHLESTESGIVIHSDGALGAQYALAALLEASGFRFHSPLHPYAPATLEPPTDVASLSHPSSPDKSLRGLHLHTLHPIEGYFSHWADGPLDDVKLIHNWLVANRGNYIQWAALADIVKSPNRASAWRDRTKQIVEDAHARGLKVGLAVELLKGSDLQNGFNLIDTNPVKGDDPTAAIDQRLTVLEGLGFDVVNVSFGEFSAFDPDVFLTTLNAAAKEIQSKLGARVSATIHVGGLPSQQVTYMGETLQYYFLVKFADPSIDPWVHSVMYYDLFEDTGGAYDMNDFADHKQFLLDRLAQGKPVGYFPEHAYWITFDDSVPLYLPLYVRSRFWDLSQIRAAATPNDLTEHVQFSSGFEWGYWQQERATLRMGYQLPAKWESTFDELFPAALSMDIQAMVNAQHDALIGQRLAAYFAGRDAYIDTGTQIGVHSEPDRPSFAAIAMLDAAGQTTFKTTVLNPLDAFATQMESVAAAVNHDADDADPDQSEVKDGAAVNAARARFIHSLYSAALTKAAGADPSALRARAAAALEVAKGAIAHRHATIRPLYREDGAPSVTIYPFGYLAQAETLCYWQRELTQIGNLLDGRSDLVDGCIL